MGEFNNKFNNNRVKGYIKNRIKTYLFIYSIRKDKFNLEY